MSKCPATQLSLEYLRGMGYEVGIVERMIPSKPFPKKVDLFNIFDLVYVSKENFNNHIGFVQTTSASNRSHRREKMKEHLSTMQALGFSGARVLVHSWKKKQNRWEILVESFDGERSFVVDLMSPKMVDVRAGVRAEKSRELERTKRATRGSVELGRLRGSTETSIASKCKDL
jgi:hypothetical protein